MANTRSGRVTRGRARGRGDRPEGRAAAEPLPRPETPGATEAPDCVGYASRD